MSTYLLYRNNYQQKYGRNFILHFVYKNEQRKCYLRTEAITFLFNTCYVL